MQALRKEAFLHRMKALQGLFRERRLGRDGAYYTYEQFLEWYPSKCDHMWKEAAGREQKPQVLQGVLLPLLRRQVAAIFARRVHAGLQHHLIDANFRAKDAWKLCAFAKYGAETWGLPDLAIQAVSTYLFPPSAVVASEWVKGVRGQGP